MVSKGEHSETLYFLCLFPHGMDTNVMVVLRHVINEHSMLSFAPAY